MKPVCSICIANYNGLGLIADCVNAVLAQDAEFPYEIIIHDDASTDQSAAYIRERYPDIRLIESKENVGYCVSNNRMAAVAQGQYLLFLNNDAMLFPDALRTLHEHASRQAQPGILGLPQFDAQTNALLDIGSLTDPFLNSVPNRETDRVDVAMVAGACLWIPATLWEKIGGFPTWFNTLAEDLYLCCVARLWGYPVQAPPHSGYRHWVGKSLGGGKITADKNLRTSRQRRTLTERNKTFVMCLCYPTTLVWLVLPLHLTLMLVEGMFITLAKRDASLWKTIYFPLVPALWKARKLILSQRKYIQNSHGRKIAFFLSTFRVFPYKLKMLIKYGLPHIQ